MERYKVIRARELSASHVGRRVRVELPALPRERGRRPEPPAEAEGTLTEIQVGYAVVDRTFAGDQYDAHLHLSVNGVGPFSVPLYAEVRLYAEAERPSVPSHVRG